MQLLNATTDLSFDFSNVEQAVPSALSFVMKKLNLANFHIISSEDLACLVVGFSSILKKLRCAYQIGNDVRGVDVGS